MNFYIYGHYRNDTGELFYIGKGTSKRAWSKHGRNSYWHNIVKKHDYFVEILHDDLSEEKAFSKEKELIKSLSPCANIASGGIGGNTWSKLPKSQKEELTKAASLRAQDSNGGIAKAAELRKGQTKKTNDGLMRMATHHSISNSGKGNPMYGRSFWNEKNKQEIDVIKQQISKTLKNTYKNNPRKYKIVECPYCKKSGGQSNMTRYHFNNCRKK